MTELSEMQFELLPSMTAIAGEVFGIGAGVSVDDAGFDPGDDDWEVEDEINPRRGGSAFGRDLLRGPLWSWALHVNQTDTATARDALSKFKTAWRAHQIRQTPGAVLPLRYRLGDKVRRVYGRPRRLAAPPDNKILTGYVPVTADFQCADGYTYDDVESVMTLGLQVGSEGGFVFPTTFPVATLPVSSSRDQLVVGGEAPTYPKIRFNGPVLNPVLATDQWQISLDLNIPSGNYVEIDLRPWAMTVLLNGTASVAGALSRRTYLADLALQPQTRYEAVFRGSSAATSGTCEVRWRNAHNSI